MNIRTRHQDRIEWTPLSPNQHAAWVSQQVSESEADILQHGQERRGLHVGDPDLILVLGQFSVEHGVEDGAADSKDVLTRPKAGRQTDSERRWLRPPSNIHHFLVVVFFNISLQFVTLCPGTRCVPPGGPTTKWTSAIVSLLNMTEFLQGVGKKQVIKNRLSNVYIKSYVQQIKHMQYIFDFIRHVLYNVQHCLCHIQYYF